MPEPPTLPPGQCGARRSGAGLRLRRRATSGTTPEGPSDRHPGGSDALDETQFASFRDGLRELGYVEAENLVIEKRFARNDPTLFPALIAKLEAAGVEVIVCGGLASCIAAKQANPPIRTVDWNPLSDAVGFGLVQNIARPEGNMTGIAGLPRSLFVGKQLGILHAAVPGAGRVGVLAPAHWPFLDEAFQDVKDAASRLVLDLEFATVEDPSGIESAIAALSAAGARALLMIPGTMFISNDVQARIAELTRAYRLPSASPDTALPRAGGLLAYSPNRTDVAYRVAWYVDKILMGAKPADLPMERPSKFDLIINLKTGQALGLTIPPSVLAQATEVIQYVRHVPPKSRTQVREGWRARGKGVRRPTAAVHQRTASPPR